MTQDLKPITASRDELNKEITERKRSEVLLQRQADLLHLSHDAIIVWQLGGHIESWNKGAEELYGYSQEEALGQATHDLLKTIHPEPWPQIEANLREGKFWEGELMHRTRDDRELIIACRKQLFRDRDGVERILETNRDITERKHVEQALKRSNENLEQFAYVASHDLQEPLRMMASFSELLERRYNDKLDTDANEFLGYIVDGAKRMQKLINDLLAYSRVGRMDRPIGEIDCNSILRKGINSMTPTIEENKAVITHDELPMLVGSESNFIQLFQNLIGNAIKFHGTEPPRVHVRTAKEGDDWVFSVRDNGIGIEPQYKDRIFLIFQRLHGRDKYPGTGIGLSICKKIVETQGGRIWVESEHGKGSTFYFTIPAKGGVEK